MARTFAQGVHSDFTWQERHALGHGVKTPAIVARNSFCCKREGYSLNYFAAQDHLRADEDLAAIILSRLVMDKNLIFNEM